MGITLLCAYDDDDGVDAFHPRVLKSQNFVGNDLRPRERAENNYYDNYTLTILRHACNVVCMFFFHNIIFCVTPLYVLNCENIIISRIFGHPVLAVFCVGTVTSAVVATYHIVLCRYAHIHRIYSHYPDIFIIIM